MNTSYDISTVRQHFPAIAYQQQGGKSFIYLDSAATTLKPESVIDVINHYNTHYSANIHRGLYRIAEQATTNYEATRAEVAAFLGASAEEIIFTKNATEGINLMMNSYFRTKVTKNDEILISAAEHHSNYLPWWQLCQETGAKLVTIPLTADGFIDIEAAESLLSNRTKLLAITLASNVTGALTLATDLIEAAHAQDIPVLLDAAQAAAHVPLNLSRLKADFLVLSGHKLYGPTGVGVLFVRKKHLADMQPWQLGGDMVKTVRVGQPIWSDGVQKFEAGTPPIAEVIGLGAAIDFIQSIGFETIARHDAELTRAGLELFGKLPGFQIVGPTNPIDRLPIFTLVHNSIHSHDLASLLAEQGICVRAGQHCAAPLLETFGIDNAIRISCGVYTTVNELKTAAQALESAVKMLLQNV